MRKFLYAHIQHIYHIYYKKYNTYVIFTNIHVVWWWGILFFIKILKFLAGKTYTSTPDALYRWSYSEGQTHISTDRETVIAEFSKLEDGSYSDGGHNTRTIC